MRALMLKTTSGSPDGVTVEHYLKGEEVELTPRLYDVFVNQMNVASAVGEKSMESAPENKSMNPPDNKSGRGSLKERIKDLPSRSDDDDF